MAVALRQPLGALLAPRRSTGPEGRSSRWSSPPGPPGHSWSLRFRLKFTTRPYRRTAVGHPPARPRPAQPRIRFLSTRSRVCATLPADPASRRRPRASLTLCRHQAEWRLSPPSCRPCAAHGSDRRPAGLRWRAVRVDRVHRAPGRSGYRALRRRQLRQCASLDRDRPAGDRGYTDPAII